MRSCTDIAVDQALRDLPGTARIDGPVALAVQDKDGCAYLGELVADHRTDAAELVDASRRPYPVAVQFLDGTGIPEIDVVTRVMPAHHPAQQRQERWQRPAQPDRRGERGNRPDAMVVRGQVERQGAAHRLSGHDDVSALCGEVVERVLHMRRPILPARALEIVRRRGMTRKSRRVAAKPVLGKDLTEAAQLRRGAGEAMDEQSPARAVPEPPGRHDVRVERIERPRSHPSSIWIVLFALGDTVARDG